MVTVRDDLALSRIEFVVLARLSVKTKAPPSGTELGTAVREFALPMESPARAKVVARETLEVLRGRGLVTKPERVRAREWGKRELTEDGRRALKVVFGLPQVPVWPEIRRAHLPALALGLKPGSAPAEKTLEDADTILTALVREQLAIDESITLTALSDALIAEALGLPDGIETIAAIRAHVLAKRLGVDPKSELIDIAKQAVAVALRPRSLDKEGLTLVLGRRWIQEAEQWDARAAASSGSAPGHATPPSQPPEPGKPSSAATLPPVAAETVLEVVRENLPRIPAEGRFGTEKVFVSAIWRSIEHDGRVTALSLDRFKRWLVRANRDGWLVLVRADLVGAMDAKLVADSEIQDRGATFHFVLDQHVGAASTGQGNHVR